MALETVNEKSMRKFVYEKVMCHIEFTDYNNKKRSSLLIVKTIVWLCVFQILHF